MRYEWHLGIWWGSIELRASFRGIWVGHTDAPFGVWINLGWLFLSAHRWPKQEDEMDQDKLAKSTTTDGKPPRPGFEDKGAPAPIDPKTGQHEAYWVLSPEERAKGFVRPVRTTYTHVGMRPTGELRDLTPEERERYGTIGYVKFEQAYGSVSGSVIGRFWTQKQLESGCGTTTSMGLSLAETYARDPSYYGSTFCVHCNGHFLVGEFVWSGTDERVGS